MRIPPTRRLIAIGALLCGLLVAAGSNAATPHLKVVAANLDNPRKLFLAKDGSIYVVEAGTGGNTGSKRCATSCVGTTGSIVRVEDGKVTPVVTGLGSFSVPGGQEAEGPVAVIASGGRYDVLMQDMQLDSHGVNKVGLPNAGELFVTSGGKAAPRTIAKLAAFEAAHNPDHGAGPGPRYAQPPIDSDPYGLVPYRGGFAVVDAAGNDLLWITPAGKISVLAVFPVRTVTLTASERRYLQQPKLRSLPVQSVPSSVTVGPDGALYVGELTGWPYRLGTARVWRVEPGKKPTVYASGFTNISDLAFDGRDLLVLEFAERGLLDPSSPGALIRVAPGGKHSVLASTGLSAPTALAVDGKTIYISNYGTSIATGAGPHGQLVSLAG